jgi:hypothetical protein
MSELEYTQGSGNVYQDLGINQPKISAMEKLIHFLNLLDQDVDIMVKDKTDLHMAYGHLEVAFVAGDL